MSANTKKDTNAGAKILSTFNIQEFSEDGRMLHEYTLSRNDHDVCTISAAERFACENLACLDGEPRVVVVSEETLTKLRQVQTDCQISRTDLAWK